MNKIALVAIIFFVLCNTAISSNWIKFAEDDGTKFYYDEDSLQCFTLVDRMSGRTLGHEAHVWIKTVTTFVEPPHEDMETWSIDCSKRKLDKKGGDYPDYSGVRIKPGSIEEELYNKLCPICLK